MLTERVTDLEKAVINEKLYYNTMPYSIYEAKLARDELNQERLAKFEQNIVNQSPGAMLNHRARLSKKKLSDP